MAWSVDAEINWALILFMQVPSSEEERQKSPCAGSL